MKILMLSWRDATNPAAGGAEYVTERLVSGLAARGHDVTLQVAAYPGCIERERKDGYTIIRRGTIHTVYLHGAIAAFGKFDRVVDQVNAVPFLTPLYLPKRKRVAFFHQLHIGVWRRELPFVQGLIGSAFERLFLPLYWNTKCVAVSGSTGDDLKRYGAIREILVMENRIDRVAIRQRKKEDAFVYVGRIKRSKRIDHCVRALAKLPNARLDVIGTGDMRYAHELRVLADSLGVGTRVVFHGAVPRSVRDDIMARSVALVMASVREGWGLVVTEANAVGTMAITYDVPGLRDSNKYGLLVEQRPDALAKAMSMVRNDGRLRTRMEAASLRDARTKVGWKCNIDALETWLH